MKRGLIVLVAIFIVLTVVTGFAPQKIDSVELLVLMYHNVIPDSLSPNKYEIRESDMRADLQYIKDSGLPCVTPSQLVEYSQGKLALSQRSIMLSFDDGFYYYNTILQKLLQEFNVQAVVSVVGSFTKFNKNTDSVARYTYMDYDDMHSMANSGQAEIAAHSYNLHSLNGRTGAARYKGEDVNSYIKMFDKDCAMLEDKLSGIGVSPICYTYPYGAYCKESEQVIKSRGYKVSMTCNEKVNVINRNPESLYLLGRYNRHGSEGSAKKIITKHWQS